MTFKQQCSIFGLRLVSAVSDCHLKVVDGPDSEPKPMPEFDFSEVDGVPRATLLVSFAPQQKKENQP